MSALVSIAVVLMAQAVQAPTAKIVIDHRGDWVRHNTQPIAVRIGQGAWQKVAAGTLQAAVDVEVPARGAAVALEVRLPGKKAFRRWGVLLPGATYTMVGNPCAFWTLEADAGTRDDQETRVRLDSSTLPASVFPVVVSSEGLEADSPGPGTAILDKPGMSAPIGLFPSAMCPGSGVNIVVRSRATKKVLLNETVIALPSRLHTLALTNAGFEVVVE